MNKFRAYIDNENEKIYTSLLNCVMMKIIMFMNVKYATSYTKKLQAPKGVASISIPPRGIRKKWEVKIWRMTFKK